MAARDIKYGNTFFKEVRNKETQAEYRADYWDLWIAIVLTQKFDNNWDALIQAIKPNTSDSFNRRDRYMALANHIRNLKEVLADLGFDVRDILSGEDADFLKKQNLKAHKKVLGLDFQGGEQTAWMINTPQKQLNEKAIHGNWADFPEDPEEFAFELDKKFKTSGYYSKGETSRLEDKIQAFLDKNTKKASVPKRIAVYRAALSVILIEMDSIDDSFGTIGGMYQELFEQYINIDRRDMGMPSEVFLTDILELMIWEDYGGIDEYETAFFKNLSPDEVLIAESILRKNAEILWGFDLTYKADNALTMLAILYARQKMFDKFVPLAKELETRHWRRITILADTAKENGKRDLALQVFEACLVEGSHYKSLKEKYEKLLNENLV